ncbi:MAG TPA: protein kinase [Candidatus Udaeobacter sp.]|nr:protein kinase [Candidatus Udaeobacter sp.]
MSIAPEIAHLELPLLDVSRNGRSSRRKRIRLGFNDGAGMINHGIGLLHEPELNKSLAFTGMEREPTVGACAICGRPLTQDGRCLRCLADLGFLSGSRESEKSESGRRLTPGPLKYDHFEVEVGADGFPIELGAGTMAITYRARDTVLNSDVALKVIDRKVAKMPGVRSRFLREARAAAQIHHPNVARVSHYGEQDGECFYVMELVEGETLEAKVRREGPMPLTLALEVIEQAARALAGAEKCGVVHRDIKPSNIMLESDPAGDAPIVKVIDYGIAKILNPEVERGAEQTQTGFIGTPAFASPEQFAPSEQTKLDTRSDIYSLGVTFWYLLSGRVPFVGRTLREVAAKQAEELPLAQLKNAHVPARVIALLQSMLAVDPAKRPPTARELLSAIHRCYTKFSTEARARKRRAAFAVAGVALIVAAISAGAWLYQRAQSLAAMERSIAVLPFENRSEDQANAYFAEGIQDEILTRLSKIGDLKVISRTSTQHYKSAPENLAEIGKQLGVAHILEGSVQRSGDGVRVNVQLIKAANDSHLWGDTFDRKLIDIFSVESEVAKSIAEQLRVKLTGQEEQVIAAKPTDNVEAYAAYLRGLAYTLKAGTTTANQLGAQKYLREAVRLDPKFALAWALLSHIDASGYITQTLQPTVALREEARQAAETALTLQPNLGEALLAKGHYHYACLKDYDTAVRYFEQARQFLPNSSQIPQSLARVARRRGQWDRIELYLNEAERLDPRDVRLLAVHGSCNGFQRRFPEALRKLDQVLNITPDDVDIIALKANIAQAEGDLPRASALLAPLHPAPDDTSALEQQVYQAILERRPAQVIARLKEILTKPDPALGYYNGELRFWLGWAQEVAGEHAAAQETWRQARSELELFLKEQPENSLLIGDLALVNMGLGDKATALALAERGMALRPIEQDALEGSARIETFARVAAGTGEPDRAIAALQKLLSISGAGQFAESMPLTPELLRLDPMFDPLRNDPRFQKLAASSESK